MSFTGSASPLGQLADPIAPDRAPRRTRLWSAVAAAVLVVGVGASMAGAMAWHGYVQDQAHDTFAAKASSVSAEVVTSLRRDLDFVSTQRAGVLALPDLTNRQLAVLFASMDITRRYPGGIGFAFVQRVLPSQLAAFGAEVVADPPVNEPVTAPYTVFPAGARPQYCLQRLGIATAVAAKAIPTTFDFCSPTIPPGNSPSPIPQLLDEATTTGRTTVLATGKIAKTSGVADLFVVFAPVYTSDVAPASLSGRASGIRGWIVATFSASALLGADGGATHGLSPSVLFEEPGGGTTTVASAGHPPTGAPFSQTTRFAAGGTWIVRVVGSAQTAAVSQALGVGALGLSVSLLLFLLLLLLTRSRAVALRLVDRRTAQLEHQALHDPLTDLPNRALIVDRAEQMLRRGRRQPLLVGALFIDLDNFKEINDTFGHAVGDQLLRAVALRLSETLRASDSIGRLGGDEFVVLAEGELGGAGPELVAERLMAVLGQPFDLDGGSIDTLVVSASIGVALGNRESADELLRDADVALYEAKARGKHCYVVFRPEMQTALRDRLELELDLRDALARGELRLVYQPTFDLYAMTVTGVEALLRWHHPVRGDVPPDTMIPIAEDTGLIIPVGRFVLEQACAQAAAWHAAGYRITMAVNVSGRQLEREDLVDHVTHALEASGLGPEWLVLEITETVLMRDTETTAARLRALKALGIRISVDDFGTGYSSLAYLRQFPVDSLKIDRSFITNIAESTESEALIHTLVQLGKSLGIETLAEGIEQSAQLLHLQHEHCDIGQGFLFSRPLEVADAEAFLAHNKIHGDVPTAITATSS